MRFGLIPISARARNALVFFAAVSLLFSVATLVFFTIGRLLEAERGIAHSREVQSALANIGTIGSRLSPAHIQTPDSENPTPFTDYQAAIPELRQAVALVAQLTADNKVQQNYCVRLQTIVNERIGLTSQFVELKNRSQPDRENEAVLAQDILRVGAETEALLKKMQALEGRLQTEMQARLQILFRRAVILLCAAFITALVFLGLYFFLLNRELRARQSAEKSLRRLNARHLEIQDEERRKIS